MADCCCNPGFRHKESRIVSRDPVCGRKVDCEDRNARSLSHEATLYFFCSTQCMTDFINDPERYARNKRGLFSLFSKK